MKFKIILLVLLSINYKVKAQNAALNFDNVDDYVQTTFPGISGNTPRTVEAWIRTSANAIGSQNVILNWGTFATGQRYTFSVLQNNSIRIEVGGSGLVGSTAVNDGQWHHVAAVYNPVATDKHALYIDGVLEIAGNINTPVNTGSAVNMRIGQRIDGINYFDGDIDEVRVFDYARTGTEIAAEMGMEYCSIPTGLVAYYRLNEGVPSGNNTASISISDESGNSYGGTLNNFALTGSSSNWINGPTIGPGATSSTLNVTTCSGYVSPSGNNVWWNSGTYADIVTGASGCDSVITVNLTSTVPSFTLTEIACDSLVSPSGNHIWYNTGIYHDTVVSPAGCDSIFTITLGINSTEITLGPIACDSYTSPSGNVITTSGIYIENLTSIYGCDSILNINLTVNSSSASTLNLTLCQNSYTPPSGTVTWTSSGTYQDIIMNSQGCDSVITINLDLTIDLSVTQDNNILTSNETNTNATYQWLDCDNNNLPIQGATDATFIAPANGNYAVLIILNGCILTSECSEVTTVGLQEKVDISKIELYPNPTTGEFQIDLGANYSHSLIRILDINGKIVFTLPSFNQQVFYLNPNLSAGLYIVQVIQQGKISNKKLVVN